MALSHTLMLAHVDITVDHVGDPTDKIGVLGSTTTFKVRIMGIKNPSDEGTISWITFIGVPQREDGELICLKMEREAQELQARGVNIETVVRADWLEERGYKEAAEQLRKFDSGF